MITQYLDIILYAVAMVSVLVILSVIFFRCFCVLRLLKRKAALFTAISLTPNTSPISLFFRACA